MNDPFTAFIGAFVAFFWLVFGIIAGLCCAASRVLRRRRARAIDTRVQAAREDIPDHVPAAWTEEFRQ